MAQLGEILEIAANILIIVGIVGTAFMILYLLLYMLELADLKRTAIGFCSMLLVVWLLVIACGVIMII